jgi:putative transposase
MSRIEHRVCQAGVYFVTTDTWQRRPLFAKANAAEIVVDQLVQCRDRGFYELNAFVLMPDHLHVLLTPAMDATLEKVMQMIKGGSSFRIKRDLQYQFPIWHAGFHDRWMRDQDEYEARLNYILQNPVVAKLVSSPTEYKWSSATENWRMDPAQFEPRTSEVEAQEALPIRVAAKAATYKPKF